MHVYFSTIIAGSVFGPALLRMSMQEALDNWHRNWPMLQLYLYIDDMGVLAQGTAHVIKHYFYVFSPLCGKPLYSPNNLTLNGIVLFGLHDSPVKI